MAVTVNRLTKEEIDAVSWFCISCCGVPTWAGFAQLIMRCEREADTLESIERWHECQHGKVRDYAIVKQVQEKIFPLIQEYKYASRIN